MLDAILGVKGSHDMNKHSDNLAKMTKYVLATITFAATLFGPAPAIAQQTEAEAAALSERAMTDEERTKWSVGCEIALPNGMIKTPSGSFETVEFDPFTFLALVALPEGHTTRQKPGEVSSAPLLPVGGIGTRDFCEGTVLFPMPGNLFAGRNQIAILLRRGLDLDLDYPSSVAQIRENRQLIQVKAGKYLVLPARFETLLDAADGLMNPMNELRLSPRYDRDGVSFWLRNTLFVPLADLGQLS